MTSVDVGAAVSDGAGSSASESTTSCNLLRAVVQSGASRQVVAATVSTLYRLEKGEPSPSARHRLGLTDGLEQQVQDAAKQAHELLDHVLCVAHNSLALAISAAKSRGILSKCLLQKLKNLNSAATALRHTTEAGLRQVLDELRSLQNQHGIGKDNIIGSFSLTKDDDQLSLAELNYFPDPLSAGDRSLDCISDPLSQNKDLAFATEGFPLNLVGVDCEPSVESILPPAAVNDMFAVPADRDEAVHLADVGPIGIGKGHSSRRMKKRGKRRDDVVVSPAVVCHGNGPVGDQLSVGSSAFVNKDEIDEYEVPRDMEDNKNKKEHPEETIGCEPNAQLAVFVKMWCDKLEIPEDEMLRISKDFTSGLAVHMVAYNLINNVYRDKKGLLTMLENLGDLGSRCGGMCTAAAWVTEDFEVKLKKPTWGALSRRVKRRIHGMLDGDTSTLALIFILLAEEDKQGRG
eukprot:TRINITY_DN16735_c0_g1_i5.p1 TRINITY_DN16735_c0_g1~~TRINITY_DN16735_c0_g1_i5.p1  ORF type:complete len:460 (-),score=97.55 TRINITY_DN16735_c0_g1_i5:277-1656(-)